MKISVIIPTRNRRDYVAKALQSLRQQQRAADEIVIIDTSDDQDHVPSISRTFGDLPLRWVDSQASVCIQRNTGIRAATGDWIFLCDDDIELNADYFKKLEEHTLQHPECGACAGLLLQKEGEMWVSQYSPKNLSDLFGRFIFQLPIWGEVDKLQVTPLLRPIYAALQKHYRVKGNALTLAGWPLITSWTEPWFRTKTYSLGANLIKREWLLNSPYDEVLDPSGIGDNYGVAINFLGPIHVLTSTFAYHARAQTNRLESPLTYYRRLLALHYFLKRWNTRASRLWFVWSLIGRTGYFVLKGSKKMAIANLKAIGLVLTGKNPYWLGFKRNEKRVQPQI
jgi:glycosyltransferase involved in cell wall biosynthesis